MKIRRFIVAVLLPGLYFTALGILWTWPLILHMSSAVAGQFGDNLQFAWQAAWLKHLLSGGSGSLFYAPNLNYPIGWSLANNELALTQMVIALPGTILSGPILGYNLAVLLSIAMSGGAMYLWIHNLADSNTSISLPGIIAGTLYACSPYWYAHFLAGHLNLLGMQWIPLYFWGLFDLLQEKPGRRPVVFTGLFLGLIALTSQYYFYMTLILSTIAALGYIVFSNLRLLGSPAFWKRLAGAVLLSLPFIALAAYPYLTLAGEGGLPGRDFASLRGYSATLEDFLVPSTSHFLWGRWISIRFNRSHWIEGSLYLGVPAMILFLGGLISCMKNTAMRKTALFLGFVSSTAFLLALGTDFHFFTQPAPYGPFARIQDWLDTQDPLYLPGTLFIKYLPFYSRIRAFRRFTVFLLTALFAGAGLGASFILKKLHPGRQVALASVILAFIFVDFGHKPIQEFSEVRPRQVDLWLARQPGNAGVAQMPFSLASEQEYVFYTIYNEKPFIGTFLNAFPPENYQRVKPILDHFPSEDSVDLLRELDIGYIVIHSTDYNDFYDLVPDFRKLGLNMAFEYDGDYVFTLDTP